MFRDKNWLERITPRTITAAAAVVATLAAIVMIMLHEAPVPEPPPAAAEAPADSTNAAAPAPAVERKLQTAVVEIRRRDTLVAALLRNDVPAGVAQAMITALQDAGADLRRVRPGDNVELARDGDGRIAQLVYAPTTWTRYRVTGDGTTWQGARSDVAPDIKVEVRHGEVRRSLWQAADEAGIDPTVLLALVRIFESEFDFNADTQAGDRFRLLVEARYADGVHADYGRVLAAQYRGSNGKTLTGVAFEADGRVGWYDDQGRSLRKSFLRSPLEFSRISSGFTHRRPHPILGGVRPHLAIDYAAPTGTPVWAVADATVKFAGRNGGNGIQVVLQHRGGYTTYYNHLSRVAASIRRGAHVDQKQVIGYVGSTGLSTGPHLDYRVAKNGVFVNPLAEDFLPGDPVPAAQRARFAEQARALIARLDQEAPFVAAGMTTTATTATTTTAGTPGAPGAPPELQRPLQRAPAGT